MQIFAFKPYILDPTIVKFSNLTGNKGLYPTQKIELIVLHFI